MIEIEIPGFKVLQLAHRVLDYNGTLAVHGELIQGVKSCLNALAGSLGIHAVTADAFGEAVHALDGLGLCDRPSVRGNRGYLHGRFRRGHGRGADQDRLGLPLRTHCQVQPAAGDRMGTRQGGVVWEMTAET